MPNHGVTVNLALSKMYSPNIFEIYFSYHINRWIVATDCYMYLYIIVPFVLAAICQLINFTAS